MEAPAYPYWKILKQAKSFFHFANCTSSNCQENFCNFVVLTFAPFCRFEARLCILDLFACEVHSTFPSMFWYSLAHHYLYSSSKNCTTNNFDINGSDPIGHSQPTFCLTWGTLSSVHVGLRIQLVFLCFPYVSNISFGFETLAIPGLFTTQILFVPFQHRVYNCNLLVEMNVICFEHFGLALIDWWRTFETASSRYRF